MAKNSKNKRLELPLIAKLLIMGIASLSFFLFWPYEPHPSWSAEFTAVFLSICFAAYTFIKFFKDDKKVELEPFSLSLFVSMFLILIIDSIAGFTNSMNSVAAFGFLTTASLLAAAVHRWHREGHNILPTLAWGLLFGAAVQYIFSILQIGNFLSDWQAFTADKPLWVPHFNPRPEANGIVFQKNHLANLTVVTGAAVSYLVCKQKLKPYVFWAHLPVGAFILALTASRTIFLYMIGIVALTFFRFEKTEFTKKFKFQLRVFAGVVLAFQLAQPYIMQGLSALSPEVYQHTAVGRITQEGGSIDKMRIGLWQHAFTNFLDHPLVANGSGSYSYDRIAVQANEEFNPGRLNNQFYFHAHNSILHLLSEYGLTVTLVLLFGVLYTFWLIVRNPLSLEHGFILVALGVSMIHSQVEHPLWFMYFVALITLFMSSANIKTFEFPKPKIAKAIAISLAVFIGIMSIKYTGDYVYLPWVKYKKERRPYTSEEAQKLFDLTNSYLLGTSASLIALEKFLDLSDKNLEFKLELTEKLVKQRPTPFTLFRRAIYLSYDGQYTEAKELVKLCFYAYNTAPQYVFVTLNKIKGDPRLFQLRDYAVQIFQETDAVNKANK